MNKIERDTVKRIEEGERDNHRVPSKQLNMKEISCKKMYEGCYNNRVKARASDFNFVHDI